MRIFTIPSWYKTQKNKETCIFIYEQMQALKKCNNEIIVLSVQPNNKLINKKIDYYNDNGLKTYYGYSFGLLRSKLKYSWQIEYKVKLFKLFKKAIEENGLPDVIYAHFSCPAGYLAIKLGKKYNIPVVIQEHYSGIMEDNIKLSLKRGLKKCVENADKFTCVSQNLKKNIIKHTNTQKEIIVISNMIDSSFKFKELNNSDNFVFSSIGSLINRKGFDLLIKAFYEEFKNEKNVKLKIAGSGIEKNNLQKLIDNYCMNDQISLIGQLSREDTISLYSNSNCFVLASRAETYGLVYREALAIGRPIISTKHGGFTETDWKDEYGKLIDIDSISQLRKAMRDIYKNYNNYNLQTISKLCLEDCSETNVIYKINDLLNKAREK